MPENLLRKLHSICGSLLDVFSGSWVEIGWGGEGEENMENTLSTRFPIILPARVLNRNIFQDVLYNFRIQ